MSLSRRDFLRVGSMMGLTTAALGSFAGLALGQHKRRDVDEFDAGLGYAIPKSALKDPLALISKAMFQKVLNTKFTFSQGGSQVAEMVLDQINDLNPPFVRGYSSGNGTMTRECFSLVFNRMTTTPLSQNTYTVTNQSLGTFQLFIVPGYTSPSVSHYEALINRVYP
jgi:hypothetical protein